MARRPPTQSQHLKTYATYSDAFGSEANRADIEAELQRWPLDAVLGFAGAISREALASGSEFYSSPRQDKWLTWALLDDYPEPLLTVSDHSPEAGVPHFEEGSVIAHTQNLALLSHLALLHSQPGQQTTAFSEQGRRRLARLLLMASDLLSPESLGAKSKDLKER